MPTITNSPPKHHPKLPSIFLKLIIMFLILSIFLIFLSLAAIVLLNLLLAGTVVNRRRRHNAGSRSHLPTFRYSAATTSDDCSICLERFKQGEVCRSLPVCEHVFHARCVDLWLKEVLNCPVCRRPVRLGVESSDLVGCEDESKFLWAIGVGRQVVW